MLARSLQRLIIFLPLLLVSQENRLRLKQADLLENKTIQGYAIQFLSGNVIFTKGQTTIACDWARYNEKKGIGLLSGSVHMTKEQQYLTADSVLYDSPNDKFTCYGQVHIWDDDYDLVADTVIYYSELDSGIASGHSKLVQEDQTITAEHLRYAKDEGEDAVSYIAENNVMIVEEARLATCGMAVYDVQNDRTWLRIKPQLKEEGRILEGSEIQMVYKEDELDYIFIPSKARALNTATGFREKSHTDQDSTTTEYIPVSFADEMSGAILQGYFKNGSLDSVQLEGMAATLYHIFEDSVYQGNNMASGDTIVMTFRKLDSATEGLESIHVRGGSRGLYTPDTANAEIDAPITYFSDEIHYDIETENTDLMGAAGIKYTDVDLQSGFININWSSSVLKALPAYPADTTAMVQKPTIIEQGREPMVGDTLVYNLKSRKGRVKHGRTKADDGYYTGDDIRNRDQQEYFIENSSYTTCDLEPPHFHFESTNMKIINQDKVIARPIVLYISRIPLFGLPFGIFPHTGGGRRSGWIMPGYGENSLRGQYIDNLGYFWAPSDHWGSKFIMSFGDRQGFIFNLENVYSQRYKFRGSLILQSRQLLSGTDNIVDIGTNRQSSYVVQWTHTQTLRHNQQFNVNAKYSSSGDFSRNYIADLQQRISQQKTTSNATYSKRWPAIQGSLSANVSSTTNLMADDRIDPASPFYEQATKTGLQTNITTATLPSMNFNLSQRNIFPNKGGPERWFNNITWLYKTTFINKVRQYYESTEEAIDDTTLAYYWNNEKQFFNDNIIRHSMSLNAPTKIFKYITFNPSIKLNSHWVNRTFSAGLDSTTNTIQTTEIPGFATRTTGSFSASINTQIYGLFPFNVGQLTAVRHVVSPSISYSYTPDFTQPLFGQDLGYFEVVTDTSGKDIFHDRFGGTLAGGTPRNESQAMNFSINNNFQAKVEDGDQSKIINLFSWRMNSGYNFVAERFKLNNLSSSIRSKIGSFNIDLSMIHDFYKYNTDSNQRINELRKNDKGIPWPRMTSMQLSTRFNLSGQKFGIGTAEAEIEIDNDMPDTLNVNPSRSEKQSGNTLWTTSFGVSYSLQRPNPNNSQNTFWLNTNSTINLTDKWRIGYTARFDLVNHELISHHFSIYRDLHCWEMSVGWTPSGYANGFNLRINVKSNVLRDLKIEKKGGAHRRMPY